jgi:DNA-binding HxlR family transcriptional regulator
MWKVLVLLRQRSWRLSELAEELGCSTRTVRQNLRMLEAVSFPVIRARSWQPSDVTIRLGSMPEWPRREDAPIRELRA